MNFNDVSPDFFPDMQGHIVLLLADSNVDLRDSTSEREHSQDPQAYGYAAVRQAAKYTERLPAHVAQASPWAIAEGLALETLPDYGAREFYEEATRGRSATYPSQLKAPSRYHVMGSQIRSPSARLPSSRLRKTELHYHNPSHLNSCVGSRITCEMQE